MAKKQHNEVAVGMTVLAALALTVYIVVVLGDWSNLFTDKQKITVRMSDVKGRKGLAKGSPVFLGGAKIGQIIEAGVDIPFKELGIFNYRTTLIKKG